MTISGYDCWKKKGLSRRRNNVFGQSIPDPRSRNVEGPTTDCRQSEHRHHQTTGAGRAECPPAVQICYSVQWSKVPWRCVVQNVVRQSVPGDARTGRRVDGKSFQTHGPEAAKPLWTDGITATSAGSNQIAHFCQMMHNISKGLPWYML